MSIELPTREDVAAWDLTRTQGEYGSDYKGTFDDTTTPTGQQADATIELASKFVNGRVLMSADDDGLCESAKHLESEATALAALYAAMMIELSHYAEQVRNRQSPYPELLALFNDRLTSLREGVEEICGDVPGAADEGGGAGSGHPVYAFDKPVTDLGFNTSW